MTYRERTIYEFTCDGCGDTEQSETGDLPIDWQQGTEETGDPDHHYCPEC